MKRPGSTMLVALAAFFIGSGSLDRAVAGRPKVSSVGQITGLTAPLVRQVVQRRDDGIGNILFAGSFSGPVDGFQVRSFLRPGMLGLERGWSPLINVTKSNGTFAGVFRQPSGGFYDLQIRPMSKGIAGLPVTVPAVGVGEVFLTAGQSNSTNFGLPTGFVPDLRVSSFSDGLGRGLNPEYPGASWQWGIDPQPAIDRSTGSSVWPLMATNLAHAYGVPIGLYSVGCGGTAIEEWQPGYVKPATLVTPRMILFNRLINAINYFQVRGGVRAILWDQGEEDTALGTDPAVYQTDLQTLIEQSRAVTGVTIKWMAARATGPPNSNPLLQGELEQAQVAVTDGLTIFQGPDTDSLGLHYRQTPPAGLTVHFNAVGIQLIGTEWGIEVANTPGFLGPGLLPPQ